jgi:hypothetical protein
LRKNEYLKRISNGISTGALAGLVVSLGVALSGCAPSAKQLKEIYHNI